MKKTLQMHVFENISKTYVSPTCFIMNLDFEGACLCASPGKSSGMVHDGFTTSDYLGGWDE